MCLDKAIRTKKPKIKYRLFIYRNDGQVASTDEIVSYDVNALADVYEFMDICGMRIIVPKSVQWRINEVSL
jgi:hypothetical protein